MIIRTDLYAVLTQGQKKRRNPYPAIFLVAGLLLLAAILEYWHLSGQRSQLRAQQEQLENKASQLEQELAIANSEAEKAATLRAQRQAVMEFAFGRVSWAPLLEEIFAAMPETVQLHSVKGNSPWQTECTLQISGRATGEQARLEADKFRSLCMDALANLGITAIATFNKLEDLENSEPLTQADFEITLRWMNTHGR